MVVGELLVVGIGEAFGHCGTAGGHYVREGGGLSETAWLTIGGEGKQGEMGGGEIRVVFKNESDNTREELMAVRPRVEEGEDGRYLKVKDERRI